MKRHPEPAATMFQAYIELTKPKITFMILISTALGYYIGGEGVIIDDTNILTNSKNVNSQLRESFMMRDSNIGLDGKRD